MATGGAWQAALRQAWFEPFAKKANVKLNEQEYTGELGKIKAMVETGNVPIDLVTVETSTVLQGCDAGVLVRLDYSKIAERSKFLPGTALDCGVGIDVYGDVLAYDTTVLKEAPTSVLDIFDTKRFPGKRALRKFPAQNLEWALMADGVPVTEVYKVLATAEGVDRAFKKLDSIKKDIVWWEAGAQPPQFLVAGDVVMSTAYNGRIDAAQKEGKNLKVVWNGSIYDLDYWAIPKGTPNKALAEQFIAYSLSPKAQQSYAQHIAYGPSNVAAIKSLDQKTLANLPNSPANGKNAVLQDIAFWTDHSDELEQRFAAWASK